MERGIERGSGADDGGSHERVIGVEKEKEEEEENRGVGGGGRGAEVKEGAEKRGAENK